MTGGSDRFPDGPEELADFIARLKRDVEPRFASVWVVAELISVKYQSTGHIYFTLKDGESVFKAKIWRTTAARVPFKLNDGLRVIVRGRVEFYPPFGELALIVTAIEPAGIGALELALRQLKQKLLAQGYFAPERKRSLPRFPKSIGIVTAPTGAAIRDMLEQLATLWPLAEVVVAGAKVQGDGAGAEIATAIRRLGQLHQNQKLKLDVIIVGRGGGSKDDLGAFNDEAVADAIFQSPVPIVTGIGHEIDESIADLVADRKADTPTAAVHLCVPRIADVRAYFLDRWKRMSAVMATRLRLARQALAQRTDRPVYRKPMLMVRDRERMLIEKAERLNRIVSTQLAMRRERVRGLAERLESLSPLSVLTRGYSLTMTAEGIVRDAATLKVGSVLKTRFGRGQAESTVTQIIEERS